MPFSLNFDKVVDLIGPFVRYACCRHLSYTVKDRDLEHLLMS